MPDTPDVTVRLFARLQEAAGAREVSVRAGDIRSVVETLVERYPALRAELLDKAGNLRSTIKVMVNGRNTAYLRCLSTPVGEGDAVAIFPLVAGG